MSVAAILDVQVQAALLGKNVKAVVQLKDEGGRLVKVQVRVYWGKVALGYAQGGPYPRGGKGKGKGKDDPRMTQALPDRACFVAPMPTYSVSYYILSLPASSCSLQCPTSQHRHRARES